MTEYVWYANPNHWTWFALGLLCGWFVAALLSLCLRDRSRRSLEHEALERSRRILQHGDWHGSPSLRLRVDNDTTAPQKHRRLE